MPLLEIEGLSVRYGAHLALDDAHLAVDEGETVAVLGANGAGKSTLLNAIAGLWRRDVRGRLRFDGADLLALPPHRLPEIGIAAVPQGRGLFTRMSVRENLELGRNPRRSRARPSRLDAVLAYFPRLAERLAQPVGTMSGGEQQMVAIGRALMTHPRLLMLDEPSLGLAPIMTTELFRALRQVACDGVTLMIVEQNAVRTLQLVQTGILLSNGRILRRDRAQALLADASVVQAFLGGVP